MSAQPAAPEDFLYRLVLWNIGLTLLDVARVNRAAYAEAFRAVTGLPLIQVPQMAGRTDSETFFDALAVNATGRWPPAPAGENSSAGSYATRAAFRVRRNLLTKQGQLMPGALDAVTKVGRLPGVVQTVVTGAIKPNAIEKLRAFGLARYLDTDIGGYGSEVYPKGALLLNARGRAAEKYRVDFTEHATVYIADSTRDVAAARIGGARSIGVASGRSSAGELRDAGADVVLADLSDTATVVARRGHFDRVQPG